MGITKHRQKILDVLQKWFSTHEQGLTLEELCQLLGMNPRQKATVQRWLQTMRGIDVEWDAHAHRSLRLLTPEPEEITIQLPVTETLRYLATGLVEWEKRSPELRSQIPEALRIGMSRIYSGFDLDEVRQRTLYKGFRHYFVPHSPENRCISRLC